MKSLQRSRQWFTIGCHAPVLVLMDLVLGFPIAWIQSKPIGEEEEEGYTPIWQPESEEKSYCFMAVAGHHSKEFCFNRNDEEDGRLAMAAAIDWVDETIPPPIVKMSRLGLYLRALQFWKYAYVWENKSLVGLVRK